MAQKTQIKLNDAQQALTAKLIDRKDIGISPSSWTGRSRFPTRTLQVLESHGLAKPKEKKNEEGKKETFWFPTAKTAKIAASL